MADKMQCVGCSTYGSDILSAYRRGEDCPRCGLSADASAAVLDVRRSQADERVKAVAEEALLRAGKAERDAERLRLLLNEMHEIVERYDSSRGVL